MPSWLSFDPVTLLLEGTPNSNDQSTNFTIVIHDSFADVLNVHVQADVATGLFQPSLKDLEIQPGGDFSLDLSPYFRDPNDIDLKIDMDPEEGWLHVEGFKISGQVPKTAKGKLSLSIKATSKSTGLTETEVLHATFLSPEKATSTATSSSSSHTSKPTAKSTAPASMNSEDARSHRLDTTDILLATILPVLFITFAVMLIVCIMRRRRHRRTYISPSKHRAKISDPIRFPLRHSDSDAETIYHVEKTIGSKKSNAQLFKKGNGIFAEVASQFSSISRRSNTLLGLSIPPRAPPELMASGARPVTDRSASLLRDDEDQASWFTVERTATGERSHKTSESCQSDTTLPEVAQPYLPTSGFLTESGESAFRSGLDLTLPSLDDLANMQPMPLVINKDSDQRASSGAFSATRTSSAALPEALAMIQEPFDPSLVSRAKEPAKEPAVDDQVDGEATENISELKQPGQARLSSQRWFSRRGSSWMDIDSNGAKSFQTEPSFGSNENWRTLARRDPSVAYLELVGETPFLPSRTASKNNVSQLEERRSLELMSPSKWGEDERKSTIRPMPSMSGISLLSDDGGSVFGEREAVAKSKVAALRREDSAAMVSERSYKIFI
jgi:axial budding pattern protein 2